MSRHAGESTLPAGIDPAHVVVSLGGDVRLHSPPGTAVRGSGSVRRCGKNGRAVVRVGFLRRSGSGSCPNLLQRRPGSGSAARRSAEYQRFSSGAPVRWGPLQQIWTNGAAAGPGRGAPIGRAGPRERPPQSPSDRGDGPPVASGRPRAPRRALRTRKCSSNRHSRVQNAHFECKMHISSAKCTSRRGSGPTPSRQPRTATARTDPRRPRPADHDSRRESRSPGPSEPTRTAGRTGSSALPRTGVLRVP